MKVVDAHIHLWDTRKVNYPWLEKPSIGYAGDNRLLPQPYGVREFLQSASGVEVSMSVNIEANPADPLAEAQWLQSLADDPSCAGHPHGIVASADFADANLPELLDRLATCPNVRGIRQILNVHSDKRYDYVGRHYLREPQWRKNHRRLLQHQWNFDLQIYPSQVADALEVIDANPDIVYIVNHTLMFVDRGSVQGWRDWREGLRSLAARGNTALKISGLAMFDHQWTTESFRPYVLDALETFGTGRTLFASNFPIDGLHCSYARLWGAYADIVSGASAHERAALFRDNATRYYRLHPRLPIRREAEAHRG
jgi:predicted TIM-barrel fold metal-dependent hydrolase